MDDNNSINVTVQEIYRLLQSQGRDIRAARTDAQSAHERLRTDLIELHEKSLETEWRVQQLEERAEATKEERRWLYTQVVGLAAGVAAVFAWLVDTYLRVKHQ
jgi:hypothetical protein